MLNILFVFLFLTVATETLVCTNKLHILVHGLKKLVNLDIRRKLLIYFLLYVSILCFLVSLSLGSWFWVMKTQFETQISYQVLNTEFNTIYFTRSRRISSSSNIFTYLPQNATHTSFTTFSLPSSPSILAKLDILSEQEILESSHFQNSKWSHQEFLFKSQTTVHCTSRPIILRTFHVTCSFIYVTSIGTTEQNRTSHSTNTSYILFFTLDSWTLVKVISHPWHGERE